MLYASNQAVAANKQEDPSDTVDDGDKSMEEVSLAKGNRLRRLVPFKCTKRAFRQYCEKNQGTFFCLIGTLYFVCLVTMLTQYVIVSNTT